MIKIDIPLETETEGQWAFSDCGLYSALIMKGSPEFINRAKNLIFNYQISKRAAFTKFKDDIYWVAIDPKKLLPGLTLYYYTELYCLHDKILLGEVDEIKLNAEAEIKAQWFIDNYIMNYKEGLSNLISRDKSQNRKRDGDVNSIYEYSMGSIRSISNKNNIRQNII